MRLRNAACFIVVLALGWSAPVHLYAQWNNNDNGHSDNDHHDDHNNNDDHWNDNYYGSYYRNDSNAEVMRQLAALKAKVAALTTALAREVAARQAADMTVQTKIDALGGGFVTQDKLDAEAATRALADGVLQRSIDAETEARIAADAAPESGIPQAQRELLSSLANYITVDHSTINGLLGPHIIFTGANVHIRNGRGVTYSASNGLGNLLVGYNNDNLGDPAVANNRFGSHNLVVGDSHRYGSNGGFVSGYANAVFGFGASVSGGFNSIASGNYASVSGGSSGTASGRASSVSGGYGNAANGDHSSVAGGNANTADGGFSSVSGGDNVTAIGFLSWAAGALHQP